MLCGRDAEVARIDRLLDVARRGTSGVLVLHGEAGIGKTALLDRARRSATDLRILTVRGSEPEQNLAFAGLAQIVSPVAGRIQQLPEPQARALAGSVALGPAKATDRFAVYAAVLSLLAQLAEEGPLLLLIDDAQWLDVPSEEAFGFVARRLAVEGIAMLVATRSVGSGGSLTHQLPSQPVGGLDQSEVTELVRVRTGVSAPPHVLAQLTHSTAGNPMALLETLEKLDAAQLAGQHPLPDLVPAVVTARALFEQRVTLLSDAARTALLLLATSASYSIQPALEAARILSVPDSTWPEVEAAGLVTIDAGTFTFTHPLVRTAASAAVSPERRRQAHRVLAAVLVDERHAEERTWHLASAVLGTDERVATALETVADVARARSGYAAAVSALVRAAALTEDRPTRARRLFAAAGDAQLAGQNGHARKLLVEADELAEDPQLRMAVAAIRGRVEAFTGHPALAHRILRPAAQAIQDTDPQGCAELLTDAAIAALLAGDTEAALEDAGRAEALARDQTGKIVLVAKLFRGLILLHMGDLPAGTRHLAESTAIARRAPDDRPAVEYVIASGLGMTWIGEHMAARELLVGVVQDLRQAGALGMLPFALSILSRAETLAGNTHSARAIATEAVELSRLTADEFWRYLALSALAYVEALLGDEKSCRANATEALALVSQGTNYPRDAAEALGLLELGLGRYDEAIARFRAGIQDAAAGAEESHPDLLEAFVRSGRTPTRRMADIVDGLAGGGGFPLHAAVAWRLRGLMADETEFSRCFDNALEFHGQVNCPFEAARSHLGFGERLRRSGQRVRAREQLRLALAHFERLHAEPWADRARTELAATGEPMSRPPSTSVADELTPQEYQVARGVVEGATNREVASALFLSTKTVEFHLSNVYRKLGVRGRTELAHRYPDLASR